MCSHNPGTIRHIDSEFYDKCLSKLVVNGVYPYIACLAVQGQSLLALAYVSRSLALSFSLPVSLLSHHAAPVNVATNKSVISTASWVPQKTVRD